MGKSSAPSAPDPYKSAAAQYQYGTQAAGYNTALQRPNIATPYGSQTWTQTPGQAGQPPSWTETQSLNPTAQQILSGQQQQQLGLTELGSGVLGQVGGALSQPLPGSNVQTSLNTSGIPGIPGSGDLSGFTNQARDAAYKQQTQYLDPQYGQQGEQLDAQLRNSGAHPGDPAYDNAMKLFTNQKQQAYESAFNNANAQGLQEQQALYGEGANTNQQMYGQRLGTMTAQNQAQAQSLAQKLGLRDQSLNELMGLQSGSQVSLPQFGQPGAGQTGTPDIMAAMQNQYAGQLAGYNANTATQNADIGSLATIAAMYALS